MSRQYHDIKPHFGGRFVALGDSITQALYFSWFDVACYLSNGAMVNAGNLGIGGDTFADMRARFSEVLDARPDYMILQGGTNDTTDGRSYVDMLADVEWIIENAINNGIQPILSLMPWYSVAGKTYKQHQMMYGVAKKYGLKVVSLWEDSFDPATGTFAVGATSDGTHPTRQVHWTAAENLLAQLDIQNTQMMVAFENNPDLTQPATMSIKENCIFLDDDGTKPDNWNWIDYGHTGALTASEVGQGFKITAVGAVGSSIPQLITTADKDTGVNIGDKYRLTFKIKHTGDGAFVYIAVRMSSSRRIIRNLQFTGASSEGVFNVEFDYQAGDDSIRPAIGLYTDAPNGTSIEISNVSMYNITQESGLQ